MKHILILILPLLLAACANKNAIETKAGLLKTLNSAAENSEIYYGHQDDLFYGHSWKYENGRSDTKEVCDAYPAVLGVDFGKIEYGQDSSLDNVKFDFMREKIVEHAERGGLITASWHVDNPLTNGNSWDVSQKNVVTEILTEGSQTNIVFMKYLQNLSDFLLTLKYKNGTKIPIIFRPWHENTGSWFWWGKDLCSSEEYISLWKKTKQYFDNQGFDNLVYCYSPNLGTDKEDYLARYAGDDFVDLLGFDAYQFPQKNENGEIVDLASEIYIENVKNALSFLTEIGKEHNRPIAFTETGCEGIPDPKWWTETLLPAIDGFPISYVLTWRNACDRPEHYYSTFAGEQSANDFVSFFNNKKIKFLKQ
ncbi:MAG: glycoside hydrolase family 26 protein [Tannerella sp.]|jgi:mannan endo-1,4-beta-mannosidase|nr:glycoside hydrolase family 26 protein [Tannerella sp.]